MPAEREMIDRPKYGSFTAADQTLRREDRPCPEGTRIWLGLSQEEQYYTRWSPETKHWWLELPDEQRDRAFRARSDEPVAVPAPDVAPPSRGTEMSASPAPETDDDASRD